MKGSVKIMQNSSEAFPRLDLQQLENQAKRWVDNYPTVPIERITLYRYSSRYQKHFKGNKIPVKYTVVFEVTATKILFKRIMAHCQTAREDDFSLCEIYEIMASKGFAELEAHTEYYQTAQLPSPFFALVNADFELVYKRLPKDNFIKEWLFIAKRSDGKFPTSAVRVSEPFWTLYDSNEDLQDKTTVKKIDNLPIGDIFPDIKKHENVFSLIGDTWIIKYKGKQTVVPNHQKHHYIAHLLKDPGSKILVPDLVSKIKGHQSHDEIPEEIKEEDLDTSKLEDEQDVQENEKLLEICYDCYTKLNEAKKTKDKEVKQKAEDAWKECRRHMLDEHGLKIIIIKHTQDIIFKKLYRPTAEMEKARHVVNKQIVNSIKTIEKFLPDLAEHLLRNIKKTRTYAIYKAEDPPVWHITF